MIVRLGRMPYRRTDSKPNRELIRSFETTGQRHFAQAKFVGCAGGLEGLCQPLTAVGCSVWSSGVASRSAAETCETVSFSNDTAMGLL
jgi:hypothetical protein